MGIAFANKIKKSSSQVYVLCGDGEFCEGTMWESALFASAKKLDNLFVLIDDNNSAGAMINMGDMQLKLEAFGFDVLVINGHNMKEIEQIIHELQELENGKPKAVIAKTVRGYGSRTMVEQDIWFHKSPNEKELQMLSREVDEF